MQFESVSTEWFDSTALRLPPYKVGRVSYGNYGRSYVRINEDGTLETPFRLYTSLTTAISTCAPTEKPLLEWYCNLGMAEADRQLRISQHYGTLMHEMFGVWLKEGQFDFGMVQPMIDGYLKAKDFWQPEVKTWERKLKFDLAAFCHFTRERNVTPLGIEYVLLSERGFGTLIDLVCDMDISETGFFGEVYKSGDNKGQPKETKRRKRIRAIINFKSGRHAFYRTNGIQIECEKQLWEENFPDMPLDAAFNWSPKEWEKEPGYNLKDWTGDISQKEVDAVMALAEVRFAQKAINKEYVEIYGTQWKTDPIKVIHKIGVEEFCTRKFSNTPKV